MIMNILQQQQHPLGSGSSDHLHWTSTENWGLQSALPGVESTCRRLGLGMYQGLNRPDIIDQQQMLLLASHQSNDHEEERKLSAMAMLQSHLPLAGSQGFGLQGQIQQQNHHLPYASVAPAANSTNVSAITSFDHFRQFREMQTLEQRRRLYGLLDMDPNLRGFCSVDSVHQQNHAPIGLNLGVRTYFSAEDGVNQSRMGKRSRAIPAAPVPLCQAEGCQADLNAAKHYHRRHKVCELHSKAATVTANGQTQRFCQQCSRFHLLGEFDEGKRSCRKRLADHNRRRRKAQAPVPSGAAAAAGQQDDAAATAEHPSSPASSSQEHSDNSKTGSGRIESRLQMNTATGQLKSTVGSSDMPQTVTDKSSAHSTLFGDQPAALGGMSLPLVPLEKQQEVVQSMNLPVKMSTSTMNSGSNSFLSSWSMKPLELLANSSDQEQQLCERGMLESKTGTSSTSSCGLFGKHYDGDCRGLELDHGHHVYELTPYYQHKV